MTLPAIDGVRAALRGVPFPGFRRDIVTLGMVTDVRVADGTVDVALRPGTDKPDVRARLVAEVERAVGALPGVRAVRVELAGSEAGRGRDPFAARAPLPGVTHVIAVASGKGGVGKSTVAANLAVALAREARGVGLVDVDVYGPSAAMMFGLDERPTMTREKRLIPPARHGVRVVSMAMFLEEQSPVIWRGPVVMGIVRQFLHDVDWGPAEFLVVDLPPGTGDAVLSLVQQVPVTGAVVVTTPQDVSLLDVGRGVAMFGQVSTPVLGVVENMAGYVCPSCGTEDALFGAGGGTRLATHFGIPLLAQIPIEPAVRAGGDRGVPITVAEPEHPVSLAFRGLASRVVAAARKMAPAATRGVDG
ncbi:MAG: Mrp/NBP35 family ATP-binding protein [bacterium]|nr:Mrp/NBP35 family ATP-binding protein [bacterium]